MDKSSSVLAALDAGKLPSQQQLSAAVDWLMNCALTQVEPTSQGGELSQQGRILVEDVRNLLNAYKQAGEDKNDDNIIQQALWHLSEADISSTSTQVVDQSEKDQASRDASVLARSIRTLLRIIWANLSQESENVLHDFASFMRLALADAADHISQSSRNAAETLRQVDEEVAKGERNEAGIRKKSEEEKQEEQGKDAKEKFESTMDTIKVAGSKTIGAGQVAVATGEDLANRTTDRLQSALYQISDRAQENAEYHSSVDTIFNIISKWIHKSLDTAGDVNTTTSLESFIDDPTPEQHLIKAIRGFRGFFERLADNKSLDDFFAALRVCGVDIQQSDELRAWFDELLDHLRRSIDERGYVRSADAQKKGEDLRERWERLTTGESPDTQKWREDVAKLKEQWNEFSKALEAGQGLQRVRSAQTKLSQDLETAMGTAVQEGAQMAMDKPVWVWQDLFNAYLPRLLSMIKDIPIPRTEYVDNDVEFVLEDLDISTFSILPGHAYIRNIVDIDIKAPVSGEAQTSVGSLTRVYAQGIQLALREVSFYFKQKTSSVGPSEFTGILELTLPPQGIDVDVVIRMIPNSPEGLKERERRKGFQEIQRVEVKISDEMDLTVKESNHQVLASVLKPVIVSRFRDTLQTLLAENIRGGLQWADSVAWDIGNRAEVFQDAGLPRGASLVAGMWSELGKLSRGEGGLLQGWKATGTGLIKDGGNTRDDAKFAMGAEPQVLSGEKHGPKGNFSQTVKGRLQEETGMDEDDMQGVVEQRTQEVGKRAREVATEAKDRVKEGVQQVRSFKQSVQQKAEAEKQTPGWESRAFDVST